LSRTAFLVDGAFYLRRHRQTFGDGPASEAVRHLVEMCKKHIESESDLYRILFYDCPPLAKKAHHPVTKKAVNFGKTPLFAFRTELHRLLVRERKVALRLGRLAQLSGWTLTEDATSALIKGTRQVSDLVEDDMTYSVRQKGVDMRIGLDIASLAFKGLVQRIVLVAGDSDFVPATKLARTEGIEVILDPMWADVPDDLVEHVDWLESHAPAPRGRRRDPLDGHTDSATRGDLQSGVFATPKLPNIGDANTGR
jgi:uncharacterized LabA/DUF88 family protein